mmetsp:Transcript_11130/g.26831  ORF Transcript_11130/g.26831 Transcript_11130/m.26831 type:complete len:581 (-) Transcript_11130:1931-3673(-)|eukprot:CAMPEP_0113617198 /NCGR_PEP_ID=MMETSP0017_2-20120614/8651_1 /TAXON_ID=2856 /ORGANISM="Cylindrotheca closterium" /LENGTH=580 /DNA_ID=CAMNT_0000526575 /DNA_START=55 /DNA_END=1797 /DNA_ORIENTATION=- /assembly_acc=CAM_ASM_000147
MPNPSTEEKRKNKGRFSLRKKNSSNKKKHKKKNGSNGPGEGSSEFLSSPGSLQEPSEEMSPQSPNHNNHNHAQHEAEETEEKHTEKRNRRKSKHKHRASANSGNNPGNSAQQKKASSSSADPNKLPNKKKAAAHKVENGRVPAGQSNNAPVSAYGLDKQAEGKNVQYTVNEKGESVQFSIDQKGVPELWLQVDHDQCLVSPMTVNSSAYASSSSLSTTQQSMDSKDPMSASKQDLFMKTSLLTIGEGGKPKENGVRPKVNSLMGGRTSDTDDDDDSIAAEEQLLNQFDDNYKKASELPKPKGKKKVAGKKKKKKEKDKDSSKDKKKHSKSAERMEMSGDEDDRKAQSQSNSIMPSAKIPSLEERSSIKLPAKNGKSGKKVKRKSEKLKAKDMKATFEEPTSPNPPPPPPTTTPPSSGGGRRPVRRIRRINSVPASTFATMDTSSPVATKDVKTRTSVAVGNNNKKGSSNTTRTSTYESPRRMNLKDLRKRFGPQQSEAALTLSPAARAAGGYVEMPTELQAYGRPSADLQRPKRPGLKRKEYRMSQRSLRNLEPESSVSDDDEDGNLVEYLKNSNYKLDL